MPQIQEKEQQLRQELESKYGQVWNTDELRRDFEVTGFCYGMVVVKRKSDGVVGSLDFTHLPRFYYSFVAN